MKIAVIANSQKGNAAHCTECLLESLKKLGAEAVVHEYIFQEFPCSYEADVRESDLVIAVGGDGTIIHTAKIAARFHKPILGVNAGRLGFTAGLEAHELPLLSNLVSRRYKVEKRSLISLRMKKDQGETELLALNDAVITGEVSQIIDYEMAINETKSYRYRADGLIIATPTGSTAYSLSAGGPVVEPTMKAMIYTPICPHSLLNRSVIFDTETRLSISVRESSRSSYLTIDGEKPILLNPDEPVTFSLSDTEVDLIRLNQRTFYDTLNEKIIRSVQ